MGIEGRVYEADSTLADSDPLLIDSVKDGTDDGSSSAGTADEGRSAIVEDDNIVANSGQVRVSATSTIVDTSLSDGFARVVLTGSAVVLVRGIVVREVV